jgi:hypothetical protein
MIRCIVALSTVLLVHLTSGVVLAQLAAVPPVPSCAAPSCAAPSCAVPASICEGCVDSNCGHKSVVACSGCSGKQCEGSSGKCCRPLINIDFSKKIYKKNNSGLGNAFGAAPPQGFAVSSMPVMPLNISTMPVSFGNATSAGLTDADLLRVARAFADAQGERASATAATAATASSDGVCDEDCERKIEQLQKSIDNINLVLKKLAAERKEKGEPKDE